jgi:hypothetical protein
MRMSLILPVAAALAVFAVESSGQAFAASRSVARDHRATPVVRDHRVGPVLRDHRTARPVARDHRVPAAKKVIRAGRNYDKTPDRKQVIVNGKRVPRKVDGGPVVRDHRTARPVVRDHRVPAAKKVIRAGRNYDKTPDRKQVVVNGKRVPRKVDGGPVVRDHRTAGPVVRDHRTARPVVRDHRIR